MFTYPCAVLELSVGNVFLIYLCISQNHCFVIIYGLYNRSDNNVCTKKENNTYSFYRYVVDFRTFFQRDFLANGHFDERCTD